VVALLLVSVSVGLGNFGAAAALGVSGVASEMRLRIAAVFGLFEAAMPLVGLAIGRTAAGDLGGHAGLVAGVVLCLAGAYTLVESVRSTHHRGDDSHDSDDSGSPGPGPSFGRLVLLGAALSLDNLAVGFALGAYHVNAIAAALVIGVISVALTLFGLELGSRLGTRLGAWAERAGGLLLVAVGVAVAAGV
jgi:manganese efflux pump family protein